MRYIIRPLLSTLALLFVLSAGVARPLTFTLTSDGNGSLTITNSGNGQAGPNWDIHWKAGAGVRSLQIIEKPGNGFYIFTNRLPPNPTPLVNMIVKNISSYCEWNYGIVWTDSQGVSHQYDPKLAINPTTPNILTIILGSALGIAIIALMFFFRRMQVAEKKVKGYEQNK